MTIPAKPTTTRRSAGVLATDAVTAALGVLALVSGFLAYYSYHYSANDNQESKGLSYGGPSSLAVVLAIGALAAVNLIGLARIQRWVLAALSLAAAVLVVGEWITFDSQGGHAKHSFGFWMLVIAAGGQLIATIVGAFAERSRGSQPGFARPGIAQPGIAQPGFAPAGVGPQAPPPPGGWAAPPP